MKTYFWPSIKLTLIMIVLLAGLYPLLITGIAKLAPGGGNGVTIEKNGKVIGFENIGQKFTDDKYFWSRPSAVNYVSDYKDQASGGSNKGPYNPDYLKATQGLIDTFMKHNPGINKADIPSDIVTASGSGLDPNISVQAAKIQVPRIARIRHIPEEKLNSLVEQYTEKPLLGLFGKEKINVLKLNIALNDLK
jgi:K+-transporting ATPase ATPase C chain